MITQLDTVAMMRAETGTSTQSGPASLKDMLAQARDVLEIFDRAGAAAHRYMELAAQTDEDLAKQGLKRSDLPRKAFDETR